MSKKSYTIVFFPRNQAFTISPSPTPDYDGVQFGWVFKDEDEITIYWDDLPCSDQKVGGILNPKLIFTPVKNNSQRYFPVQRKNYGEGDPWLNINSNDGVYEFAQNGETFKVVMVNNGAKWSFDFTCTIDNKEYFVDPEMEIGSGSD